MYKLSLISLVLFIFLGCEDKSEKQKLHKEAINNSTTKIEIVENKNLYEIKVAEKNIKNIKDDKNYYFNYGINSSYDPNSAPANKDASVRIKPRTQIDANINVRSPYEKVQVSMLVKKLSKKFMVKCSACHNDYANGIIGPSLLNKTSTEILKNINDFKIGIKTNPLMNDLIKMMKSSEIKDLANEIYEFNKKIKKLQGKK
jgi:cytochrome c553